jgi:integrase
VTAWAEPMGQRWRVRTRLRGRVVTVEGSIATREEAERFAETYSRLVADGTIADPRGITLGSWGSDWLDRRELDGVRGIRQERSVWARHVADSTLASLRLDAIRAPHVADWLDAVRSARRTRTVREGDTHRLVEEQETVSRQTAAHALRLVRGALAYAVTRGLLETSPAAAVRLPREARVEDPWTWLTADELARVVELAPPLFTVAVFTGLRRGELFALRWEDVDLERARLHVRRSLDGATKSGKSRLVPLLPPALAALRRILDERTAAQRAQDRVFARADGEAYARGYTGRWDTWRERCGITRPVRFHDLRHTCASHLVLGTWGRTLRLDEVRAWLGHSSITVTQRYAHLGDGHLDELARMMSSAPALLLSAPTDFQDLSAPPGGFEPPTVGLEGRYGGERFREVTPVSERLRSMALEYLASVGQPGERHAAITLAEAVLDATEQSAEDGQAARSM